MAGKRKSKTRAIVAGYVEKVSAQIFDRYPLRYSYLRFYTNAAGFSITE
jgi:hypothetical protein